jgi:hypothetical protein
VRLNQHHGRACDKGAALSLRRHIAAPPYCGAVIAVHENETTAAVL